MSWLKVTEGDCGEAAGAQPSQAQHQHGAAEPCRGLAAGGWHQGKLRHPQPAPEMLGTRMGPGRRCPQQGQAVPAHPKQGTQRLCGHPSPLRPCCRARTGHEGHSLPPGAVPHALGSLSGRAVSNYRREMQPPPGHGQPQRPETAVAPGSWHRAWLPGSCHAHRPVQGTKFGVSGDVPCSRACSGASHLEGGMVSARDSTQTLRQEELLGYIHERWVCVCVGGG